MLVQERLEIELLRKDVVQLPQSAHDGAALIAPRAEVTVQQWVVYGDLDLTQVRNGNLTFRNFQIKILSLANFGNVSAYLDYADLVHGPDGNVAWILKCPQQWQGRQNNKKNEVHVLASLRTFLDSSFMRDKNDSTGGDLIC